MKSKLLLLLISGLSWLNAYNQSVVDIIVASPDHNTLEAAIGAAGLAPTL